MFWRNAYGKQLAATGFREIQEYLLRQISMARRASAEKKHWILFANRIRLDGLAKKIGRVRKLRLEVLTHLVADLVAASANAWTDRSQDVTRQGSKPAPHFSCAFFNDSLERSPPAGMENSDGSSFAIRQNDWNTIRRLNPQQKPWSASDQAVAS